MIAAMRDEPKFSELFMADLLNRNSRIEEDLIDQLFNSSEKRLARVLLLLANFGREGGREPIVGKFSQELLAEMVGTTRSRVSHFIIKFCKLGRVDGFDQDEAESKRDERAVILRRLLASKCDTVEAFELADRLFDACLAL